MEDSNIPNLVRHGINDLKAYVPGKPVEEVKEELGLREIIKLASNENPLGASPKAIEAIKQVTHTKALGQEMYSTYLLPFEIGGLILLVGAVSLVQAGGGAQSITFVHVLLGPGGHAWSSRPYY